MKVGKQEAAHCLLYFFIGVLSLSPPTEFPLAFQREWRLVPSIIFGIDSSSLEEIFVDSDFRRI